MKPIRRALLFVPALLLLGHDLNLPVAWGDDAPRRRLQVFVIADGRDARARQPLPGPPGVGTPRSNLAITLTDYLIGRDYRVTEFTAGHRMTAEDLRGVNLVLCLAAPRPYVMAEIVAYTQFVEQGGTLLISAGPRSPLRNATAPGQRLDAALGVEIGTRLPGTGSTTGAPGTIAGPDLEIAAESGMTAVSRGRGKVLCLGSVQPLTSVAQPFTDRVLAWLMSPVEPSVPATVSPVSASAPAAPAVPPLAPEERETYRAAAEKAGPDAEAQVRLALWCEAHGLTAERLAHLNRALKADPDHATAHRLLGEIFEDGGWRAVGAPAEREPADGAIGQVLAEYNARREKTPDKAEDQWRLALWCEEHGLKAEARAHLTVVTRLAPGRAEAWQRLGCKRYNGRWLTERQIAAEIAETEAQKQADRVWQFQLETLARRYFGLESERSAWLEEASKVTDPRAVPAVWRVFAKNKSSARLQEGAVLLLKQIDSPLSSQRLAVLTLFGRTPSARRDATSALLGRDPRDFLDMMIGVLYPTLDYRVRRTRGGQEASELLVEGERFNLRGIYTPDPPVAGVARLAPGGMPIDGASIRLNADIAEVDRYNATVRQMNAPLLDILRKVTGGDPGSGREEWRSWWTDQKGYFYALPPASRKPTLVQYSVSQPLLAPPQAPRSGSPGASHTACFGAGTPVRTATGLRPIEELRVGDQVLTQDTQAGALNFQPIVAVFHNPPGTTVRVQLGEETVVATGIHRFWKAGTGWVMARDLKPGDPIRTLDGRLGVGAVQSGEVQPVFNLEVAEGKSFFVGKSGALVHDNTLVDPVPRPFDSEPVLATTAIQPAP